MSMMMRRERGFMPEFFDLLETPFVNLRTAAQAVRMEDQVKENQYVLRAELPGIDPEKDLEITISGGVLTIHAERQQRETGTHHSEFRYGTMTRSITLPPTAQGQEAKASYENGILEITVPLAEAKEEGTRVPVTAPKQKGKA